MNPDVIYDWLCVVVAGMFIGALIGALVKFLRMPSDEQIRIIKQCLLNWVVQAETELGSGTGKVKLSEVYGQFVNAFPFLKSYVPFDTFSVWVDEALEQMRSMLQSNANLRQAVGIEEGTKV